MTDILRTLAAHKWTEVARRRKQESLPPRVRALRPRWFHDTLATPRRDGTLRVIAEVKQRSPSKGELRTGLDHAALARQYRAAGADALSVLVDEQFFGGSPAIFRALAAASECPVLYKDVVVDAWQIDDAVSAGADAILLMARVVSSDLAPFHARAAGAGLDVLVEAHDATEITHALDAGATIVGVNARDFVSFSEDAAGAASLLATIPDGIVRVAESALRHPDDVARAAIAGAHAVLIGEAFVRADDPAATLRSFLGRPLETS